MMLKKSLLILVSGLTILVFLLPMGIYWHTLGFVNPKPVKPTELIIRSKLRIYWEKHDLSNIDKVSSITPYWMYYFLFVVVAHDYFKYDGIKPLYSKVSKMAGMIAIAHMREGYYDRDKRSMLWWHLTHISLSIWIQRHWEPIEIVSKYQQMSKVK